MQMQTEMLQCRGQCDEPRGRDGSFIPFHSFSLFMRREAQGGEERGNSLKIIKPFSNQGERRKVKDGWNIIQVGK